MLVIRRRVGEAIVIGDGIELEILEIAPTRVKLGVRAPQEVRVMRKEMEMIGQENVAAASSDTGQLLALLQSRFRGAETPSPLTHRPEEAPKDS